MSEFNRLASTALVGALSVLVLASGLRLKQAEAGFALGEAEASLQRMESGYLKDFALTEIIRERARQADFPAALRLVQTIEHADERDQALLAVASEQASRDIRAALDTSAKIIRAEFRGRAQGQAALALARAGQFSSGLSTAGAIDEEGARFSAACAIAAEMFRQGRNGEAESLVSESTAIQSVLKNWADSAPSQGAEGMARAMFDTKFITFILRQKSAEPIRLEDISASIYDYGYSIGAVMQFGEIAGLRARMGDGESSERLIRAYIELLRPEDDHDVAYSQIGVGRALTSDTQGAMLTARSCVRAEARDLVYLAIVTDRAQSGDVAKAEDAMRLITTEPARLGGYCELARILAPKMPAKATAYLKPAEKDSVSAGASDPGHFYIGSMVSAYAALKRGPEALRWLARLESEFGSQPTYEPNEMVDLYLAAGDAATAHRWASADIQAFAEILEYQWNHKDVTGVRATALIAHSAMTVAIARRGPSEAISAVCRAEARILDSSLLTAWVRSLPSAESQVYAWVGVAQGLFDRQPATGDARPIPAYRLPVIQSPDGLFMTGGGEVHKPQL